MLAMTKILYLYLSALGSVTTLMFALFTLASVTYFIPVLNDRKLGFVERTFSLAVVIFFMTWGGIVTYVMGSMTWDMIQHLR